MKIQHLLPALLFACLLFSACEESSDSGHSGTDTDSLAVVPDSIEEMIGFEDPMIDPEAFENLEFGYRGMDVARIGDTISLVDWNLQGVTVRDTLFREYGDGLSGPEEYTWPVKIMSFSDGQVFFEGDYDRGETINRIRIETPQYRHFQSKVGVGNSVKELKAVYSDLFVRPFKDYGVIELVPSNSNIFHIPYQELDDPNLQTWDLSLLPDDPKVIRVVVM